MAFMKRATRIPSFVNDPARMAFPGTLLTTKELVSKLKKRITEAENKAHEAVVNGDVRRAEELRKNAAIASVKLRAIIDGRISPSAVDKELADAIRSLEKALS